MKPIRRYYTRKEVAEQLGIKCYQVSYKLMGIKDKAKSEIRRLEKKVEKLSLGKRGGGSASRYTDYHLEQLRNEIIK